MYYGNIRTYILYSQKKIYPDCNTFQTRYILLRFQIRNRIFFFLFTSLYLFAYPRIKRSVSIRDKRENHMNVNANTTNQYHRYYFPSSNNERWELREMNGKCTWKQIYRHYLSLYLTNDISLTILSISFYFFLHFLKDTRNKQTRIIISRKRILT